MTPEQAWALAYGAPAASTYSAPATTNYGDLSSGIGQDVLSRMANTRMWDPSGGNGEGGQWGWEGGNPIYGSDPNGNPIAPTFQPSLLAYHPQGQGVGEQFPTFDPQTGEFKGYETGSKVQSYLSGIASVAGAALGMGAAFGGAGAGGYAAGGYAGGGGAGAAGAGGAGVTGFGDAGTMYAGADGASAGSLGGGASVGYGGGTAAMGAGASGLGSGSVDLGSGLSMGADGSISGAGSLGAAPSNAGIMSDVGAGGSSSGFDFGNLFSGSGSTADWLKLGSLAAGALGGSKGVQKTTTQTAALDPRMDSLVYGQLAPYAQNLLSGQTPQAQLAGAQMLSTGSGLLGQQAPTTATNPYLKSVADDMQRRTQLMLGQNNLAIQGNSVATGGLGGARQGVAQGIAAGQAADNLQGNVANLYGTAYTGDQNRLLQQQTLGAGLLSQGLDTMWAPAKNAASVYSPFTGFGGTTTQNQSQGGGTMGAVGGAIGAYGMGKQLGWW